MTTERERVICVSLTDAEWRALVARHPEPHHWLREQILDQLDEPAAKAPKQAATVQRPHVSTRGRV